MQLRLHNAILSTILATTWVHQSSARLEATKDSRALMKPFDMDNDNNSEWYIISANRGSVGRNNGSEIPGTISIIKESANPMSDDTGVTNVDLKKFLHSYGAFPSTATKSEPLYVNISPKQYGDEPTNAGEGCIFVSDEGINGVAVIDPTGKMDPKVVEFDTDKCSGMFHGMGNGPVPGIKPNNGPGSENYLINICTVTNSLALLRYSDMEVVYVQLGNEANPNCVPHDLIVNLNNDIFTTNFSDDSSNLCQNQIIKLNADAAFKLAKKKKTDDIDVEDVDGFDVKNIGENCEPDTNDCVMASGIDPHLGCASNDGDFIYVPIQKGGGALNGPGFGRVAVYSADDLTFKSEQALDLAHGIAFSTDDTKFYVTSIGKGMVTEFEAVDGDGILGPPGIVGTVPQAVLGQGAGTAHNPVVTPDGNLYITASHPPPKAVKSWAVSKFTIPQDGSSSSSGDESEIMSNGFFTVGVPKSLYADTTALPDSNAFGITKYLGMIDMEQFGDATKIVAL